MLNGQRMSFWRGVLNLALALGRWVLSPGLWASAVLAWLVIRTTVNCADGLTPVTLVVNGAPRQVRALGATVGQVLQDAEVEVGEWDLITPDPGVAVRSRMTIVVQHARLVTIVADGVTTKVHTHSYDVQEILGNAGVRLVQGDVVWVNGQVFATDHDTQAASVDASALGIGGQDVARPVLSSRGRGEWLRQSLPTHIRVQRAARIYLRDGGIEQSLRTVARTVGQVLSEAETVLYVGDHVYPDLNTPVTAGLRVRIERGVPVSVTADGRTLRTRTHSRNVGQVLAEMGISLMGRDFVEPALDSPLDGWMHIRVVRVVEKLVVEQQEIPFETEWLPDASLDLDHRRVDDEGGNGMTRRRYKATFQDGQEVKRVLEEEWVAQEPRPRQIAYGTHIVIRTLEAPSGSIEYWRRIRVFLTSYTAATCGKTPDDPEYGITRLGWTMRHGIIAVDPRVVRLLSQLYVPGYGRGVAGDTGGMINGRHIDLGYDEGNFIMHYEWGYVYVLTPVPPPSQIRWILPDFPRER